MLFRSFKLCYFHHHSLGNEFSSPISNALFPLASYNSDLQEYLIILRSSTVGSYRAYLSSHILVKLRNVSNIELLKTPLSLPVTRIRRWLKCGASDGIGRSILEVKSSIRVAAKRKHLTNLYLLLRIGYAHTSRCVKEHKPLLDIKKFVKEYGR